MTTTSARWRASLPVTGARPPRLDPAPLGTAPRSAAISPIIPGGPAAAPSADVPASPNTTVPSLLPRRVAA